LSQVTRVVRSPYVFTRLETMERMKQPREVLKRARKQAKLEWVGFHDFRHFRATQWIKNKVDVRVVKEWLGHRDITTTMRYLHFAPSHARESAIEAQRLEQLELAAGNRSRGQ